jgi:TetR/AcrR family transcriptional repressor of nem operon
VRITKEKASENKQRILEAAARLFRERGFDGIGVADLMREAGFSHGGFYNHFSSKEELIAAASALAFEELDADTQGRGIEAILGRYMSQDHRDDLPRSCPAAALGGDAGRQSDQTQTVFKEGVLSWLSRIEGALEQNSSLSERARRDTAINLFAKAVGAVVISRSVSSDSQLSDEILQVCLAGSLNEAGIRPDE